MCLEDLAIDNLSDASGKLCTKDLKKSQYTRGNDGNIDTLDRACGDTLFHVFPRFISSQHHSVKCER